MVIYNSIITLGNPHRQSRAITSKCGTIKRLKELGYDTTKKPLITEDDNWSFPIDKGGIILKLTKEIYNI